MLAACAGLLSLPAENVGVCAEKRSALNIVFILADDLGQRDLGCYGSTFYETPNLDRMARDGARFTDAYAGCPVCSPTRASIMSGQWPQRTGVTDYIGAPLTPEQWKRNTRSLPAPYSDRLALDAPTLAKAMKAAGYATFFAGKWHLGPEGWWPENQGFEVNKGGIDRGGPYGGNKYFSPYGNPRLSDGPPGEHLPDRLASETARFIEAKKDQPFFAYLAFYSVHTPLMAREDLRQKYEQKRARLGLEAKWGREGTRDVRLVQEHAVYAGMVEAMDQAVGKVLAKLDQLGLTDKTLVIFTSDNGGLSTSEGWPTSNLPLRAGKGWVYEGGIREPLLVRWPGVVRPGSVLSTPVCSPDFFPTLLEAVGARPQPGQVLDGTSLVPVLAGGSLPERALCWHYPHYGNQGGAPGAAIRRGDWKLIEWLEDGRIELFNLAKDIGEQRDLAHAEPARAEALREELHVWQKRVGAKFPRPNPAYDPAQPSGRASKRPRSEPAVKVPAGKQARIGRKPNIVLVMTDDQGYGDLGCTGNPIIKTPNIDRLAAESSQLTDYHVAPTCSPTRSALLTGHWTDRTGVWHTVNGRSMLRENEITLGQLLKDHGYATGMFGKWHLGDNYPYRPEDRGFTEVYRHGGGGVGQTPDLWNNAYFDGHYFHNGRIVPAKGFCTDVFFGQARRFIRQCARRGQPFLAYIAPNAPHGPLHAPQKYLDLYEGQDPNIAAFYAMITNIDDNVGATRELLGELGIADNTIFIFTTDNGTATGARIYNAGMRGAKGSEYDGGHRVPLFCHWPKAGMNRKHVCDTLAHAVDIVPTLLDMTGAKAPAGLKFDGVSIRALLDPNAKVQWPDRFLVTDSQRVRDPIKWKQTAVMSQQWRLVNGTELYAIKTDPGQARDVAREHPEQVAKMRAFYDAWWAELEPTFAQTTEIYLGHRDHPVVSLTGHDWIQEALPPWNQAHIRQGYGLPGTAKPRPRAKAKPKPAVTTAAGKSVHQGHWAVKVVRAGRYEIRLRRWPVEADQPITAGLPAEPDVPGASKAFRAHEGLAIPIVRATLRLDGRDVETRPVAADDREVTFTADLAAGSHQLAPLFTTADGNQLGAYYAVVARLP